MKLVPDIRRPQVAVIVLTQIPHRALWELAKENGAYACFHKYHTSGEDLDKAIQRAIAFVGQMPKEDRKPTPSSPSDSSSTEYDELPR
jgi:DNA-binding NarL/FixJ family response regulator